MRKLLLAVAAMGMLGSSALAQGQPSGDPRSGYRPHPPVIGQSTLPRNLQAPGTFQVPPGRQSPDVRRPGPPPYVGPPGPPPYVARPSWRHRQPYDWCQSKAARLHEFEYRAQQDGRVSRDEMRIARSLRADLASSCGGGRWTPNRGWYYR